MKARAAKINIKEEVIRQSVVGIDERVPTLSGAMRTYINFDNAASTPPLATVVKAIDSFMPWYSSVHRGSGFKSQLSSNIFDEARTVVMDFFGANASEYTAIFGKNTTEAINKLSYRLGLTKDDVVIVGLSEHHSNDLPWRARASVYHAPVDGMGNLDIAALKKLITKHTGKLKLVAISGGSNVTGAIAPVYEIAKLAHRAGAQILVDCAQLAPHRAVNMKSLTSDDHLDYVAASAHKMYAPFGTGVLIGRKDTFASGAPEICGGGTIKVVTKDRVEWADTPDRDEAGSPNVVGVLAFATSIKQIQKIGMDFIAEHEARLTAYLLDKLRDIPGLTVYGDVRPETSDQRLGVISFNIKDMPHGLVAAILSAEWAIGVRDGCFCAHPYVTKLLGLDAADMEKFTAGMMADDRRRVPGMVRVSFGMYNQAAEIDILADALEQIAAGAHEGEYYQDKTSGQYLPKNWHPDFGKYFSL